MSRAMRERPILFSAPMVRTILDGRKTQTRRVVEPQPTSNGCGGRGIEHIGGAWFRIWSDPLGKSTDVHCKYGQVDDWLWVKETHQAHPIYGSPVYRADWPTCHNPVEDEGWPWKPSIFMPRRLSRITLRIAGVRVERLQEISEADAIAEGIKPVKFGRVDGGFEWSATEDGTSTAIESYSRLWDCINAKRGFGWAANPWVWAIEFRRVVP